MNYYFFSRQELLQKVKEKLRNVVVKKKLLNIILKITMFWKKMQKINIETCSNPQEPRLWSQWWVFDTLTMYHSQLTNIIRTRFSPIKPCLMSPLTQTYNHPATATNLRPHMLQKAKKVLNHSMEKLDKDM